MSLKHNKFPKAHSVLLLLQLSFQFFLQPRPLSYFLFFQGHPTAIFHFKKNSDGDQRNVLPPVNRSQPPPSFSERRVSP